MGKIDVSRNATTPDTTDVLLAVCELGISVPHLVRPLDENYISELVQTDESVWEPIEVRRWPISWPKSDSMVAYHVVSGNHRTSAAQIKRLSHIRARVIEASDDLSYMIAAIRTNSRHGRNFTEDDRRVLAGKLKGLGQSADEIASLFSVNRATVYNWLSGRDSNASKKKAAARDQSSILSDLGVQEPGEDWRNVPAVTVDARKIAMVGQAINNFLAETPTNEDRTYIAAWSRSLSREARQSIAQDMLETIQWLTNVSSLLREG